MKVPEWIKLRQELEAEFYGSLLGGELGTPIIHKRGNYLTSLEVGITGSPDLKSNRLSFLGEVVDFLKRNRVNVTSIYEGRTNRDDSLIYRMLIEKKMDNVILFMMSIKLNYCRYKTDRLYLALGQWAALKRDKFNELTKKGYGAERAMDVLNLSPNSLYLILNNYPEAAI